MEAYNRGVKAAEVAAMEAYNRGVQAVHAAAKVNAERQQEKLRCLTLTNRSSLLLYPHVHTFYDTESRLYFPTKCMVDPILISHTNLVPDRF